ncbi:MAG TPA: metallophosphoesterase [Candidatus Nanoarchaeia archaeon]|nr:metallophosphoesterase [Candidatus Nanoarchaeia archaeon]
MEKDKGATKNTDKEELSGKELKNSKSKTKILAVGDIHGDTGLIKKLAEKAKRENVDLIILAGDLTFFEKDTENLIGPFIKAEKEVLLVPGNHESVATINFLSEMYPNAKNIHGYSFKKGDLGIFGAGGANMIGSKTRDKEIFELLKKGHEEVRDSQKKIMVTHMHHAGSKAEFSGFKGSEGVRRAIKDFQPDLLISAHIHEAGGLQEKLGKTKIINVSRTPTIFEI